MSEKNKLQASVIIHDEELKDIKYVELSRWHSKSTHHIKMWQHNDHSGHMIEVHDAMPISSMGPLNDMMSLVEIHRGEWGLFEHDNYQGKRLRLGYGAHQLMDMGFNDILSSLRPVQ